MISYNFLKNARVHAVIREIMTWETVRRDVATLMYESAGLFCPPVTPLPRQVAAIMSAHTPGTGY